MSDARAEAGPEVEDPPVKLQLLLSSKYPLQTEILRILLTYKVLNVPVFYLADVLKRRDSRRPDNIPTRGPGLDIRFRIFNSRFVMHIVEGGTRVFLDHVQFLGMRLAGGIDQG